MKSIEEKNKKAYFDYEILEDYLAGIQLFGSEIKSLRNGDASIKEAYCYIYNREMFIKSMFIQEYEKSSYNNHEPRRDRKLLLNKKEIIKLEKKKKEGGCTIVPLKLFINKRGLAKLVIGLAKGKKNYDKRERIKKRESDIDLSRLMKKRV